MQQNTPKKIENNLIKSLLSAADPMESRRVQNRMLMAARIQDAMKAQKIGKKQLAEILGKSPSLVTKYLSGTQNLTMDTLSDLEYILGVKLLEIEFISSPTGLVKNNSSSLAKLPTMQTEAEMMEFA
jgi:transcriptional regulator with XRE-family HTH domain